MLNLNYATFQAVSLSFGTEPIHPAKGEVLASAFMPPKDLQLSTFHIDGLTEQDVWAIGEKNAAGPLKKPLYGRGDIRGSNIPGSLAAKLNDDPPRHVTVSGWPVEKERQKEMALKMALAATLVLNSQVILGFLQRGSAIPRTFFSALRKYCHSIRVGPQNSQIVCQCPHAAWATFNSAKMMTPAPVWRRVVTCA